jgi:hypothetical protein
VLLLAAAIALLWQDYQTWKNGGDSLIDWGRWKKDIDWALEQIEKLKNAIKSIPRFVSEAKEKFASTVPGGAAANTASDKTRDAITGWFKSKFSATNSGATGGGNSLVDAIAHEEGFHANANNRPTRNHNPGDIEYGAFAKAHGATGSDGRFAIFPDDATGTAALRSLLGSKNYKNLTIPQAIARLGPPNENDTAKYTKNVLARTGLSPTSTVSQALSGTSGATDPLNSYISRAGSGGMSPSDNSVTNHIGTIVVQTQATDAKGIASDMGQSMNYLFTSQANTGMF